MEHQIRSNSDIAMTKAGERPLLVSHYLLINPHRRPLRGRRDK